jgi:heavy metal sensor kinase
MSTRSIYFRLILWYSGLVTVVSLAFGAYTYQGVERRMYREMEQTLARRARQIADNILAHVHEEPYKTIEEQIQEVYSPEANNRFIRILRADGSVFYTSGKPKDGLFDPLKIPLPEEYGPMQRIEKLSATTVSMFIVKTRTEAGGESFVIEMGIPTEELDIALHGLITTLLFGLPIVVLVVSAGGYILVRRSLKPVEDIRATAEQITFGNLSNRLPVSRTGDALEHLSVTLNQMLERLDNAYQQVSRFSADASHELRTPLTIMRGELESILQRESGMSEALCERIGSVLEEAERLSRITESLFAISRLDAGEARIEPITFYLVDLVRTTTDQMLLLAEEKSIRIAVEADNAARIKGDAARLKQVVVNLLDNAIKYTPAGGRIFIRISTTASRMAVLEIADNGVGIPAAALPHIFERFYRADKVRSRELGGAGLGLSIVRSICQAHGGSVEITSEEGKGTTCRVELPLAGDMED